MHFLGLGKRSGRYELSRELFVLAVQLVEPGQLLQSTLSSDSLGQDCLDYVCQRLQLQQSVYFGLKFKSGDMFRWVDLRRPLRKQLEKYAQEHRLYFAVLFHTPRPQAITDSVARYYYYLQMRNDVIEGRLLVPPEKAKLLSSYSLQVELGDHIPETHTVEFLKSYHLLPKHMMSPSSQVQQDLTRHVIAGHQSLRGMPQSHAELLYIHEAQLCDGYGEEYFQAKDYESNEVFIGYCQQGIVAKRFIQSAPMKYKWGDISNIACHKRNLLIHSSQFSTVHFVMEDVEMAKYARMLFSMQLEFARSFVWKSRSGQRNGSVTGNDYQWKLDQEADTLRNISLQHYTKRASLPFVADSLPSAARRPSGERELRFAQDARPAVEHVQPSARANSPPPLALISQSVSPDSPVKSLAQGAVRGPSSPPPAYPAALFSPTLAEWRARRHPDLVGSLPRIDLLRARAAVVAAGRYQQGYRRSALCTSAPDLARGLHHHLYEAFPPPPPPPLMLMGRAEGERRVVADEGTQTSSRESALDTAPLSTLPATAQGGGEREEQTDWRSLGSRGRTQSMPPQKLLTAAAAAADCGGSGGVERVPPGRQNVALNGVALARPDLLPRSEASEAVSNDERLSDLELRLADGVQIAAEFAAVPRKRVSAGLSTALKAENQRRNRFANILPYEDTRVMLRPNRNNTLGYVNASNVQMPAGGGRLLRYVATQAPLKQTAADFWQMVWQSGARILVMLTECQDPLTKREQSFAYWPSKREGKLRFGDFEVALQAVSSSPSQAVSSLLLKHTVSGQKRLVYHLQYRRWPTGKQPETVASFLAFMDEVSSVRRHLENEMERDGDSSADDGVGRGRLPLPTFGARGRAASVDASVGLRVQPSSVDAAADYGLSTVDGGGAAPTIVHCCSGAGRTGVYILVEMMVFCLEHNHNLDMARALSMLRQQRMQLVQSASQYRFAYECLVEYLSNSRLI